MSINNGNEQIFIKGREVASKKYVNSFKPLTITLTDSHKVDKSDSATMEVIYEIIRRYVNQEPIDLLIESLTRDGKHTVPYYIKFMLSSIDLRRMNGTSGDTNVIQLICSTNYVSSGYQPYGVLYTPWDICILEITYDPSTNEYIEGSLNPSVSFKSYYMLNGTTSSEFPLGPENTWEYPVSNDYTPAHKKYVDDAVATALGDVNTILATLTTVTEEVSE